MPRRAKTQDQLDLFGPPPPVLLPPTEPEPLGPAVLEGELRSLADRLPRQVYLGCSSWSFPGWAGLVYNRKATEKELSHQGLPAYAHHPLFRAVGVDRTYYAPADRSLFEAYAGQVPEDFRFLVKACELCTLASYPRQVRHGERQGTANSLFLEPGFARDQVVQPFAEGLGPKGGPLVFQFPPQSLEALGGAEGFPERLHGFLEALPRGPLYAVEVRNPELLSPAYAQALEAVGALPVLSAWGKLPPLTEQAVLTRALERQALVIRWMLPQGFTYESAMDRFAPFHELAMPDEGTRGQVCELVLAMAGKGRPGYVIINNKAEGSSPRSVVALARRMAGT